MKNEQDEERARAFDKAAGKHPMLVDEKADHRADERARIVASLQRGGRLRELVDSHQISHRNASPTDLMTDLADAIASDLV